MIFSWNVQSVVFKGNIVPDINGHIRKVLKGLRNKKKLFCWWMGLEQTSLTTPLLPLKALLLTCYIHKHAHNSRPPWSICLPSGAPQTTDQCPKTPDRCPVNLRLVPQNLPAGQLAGTHNRAVCWGTSWWFTWHRSAVWGAPVSSLGGTGQRFQGHRMADILNF